MCDTAPPKGLKALPAVGSADLTLLGKLVLFYLFPRLWLGTLTHGTGAFSKQLFLVSLWQKEAIHGLLISPGGHPFLANH